MIKIGILLNNIKRKSNNFKIELTNISLLKYLNHKFSQQSEIQ